MRMPPRLLVLERLVHNSHLRATGVETGGEEDLIAPIFKGRRWGGEGLPLCYELIPTSFGDEIRGRGLSLLGLLLGGCLI